ncbi:MAG: hypothetical protein JWQ85_4119 [Mucilaginibacter sp.]|nr:hypothetical protein [Mucilaginibacter sp.]
MMQLYSNATCILRVFALNVDNYNYLAHFNK